MYDSSEVTPYDVARLIARIRERIGKLETGPYPGEDCRSASQNLGPEIKSAESRPRSV